MVIAYDRMQRKADKPPAMTSEQTAEYLRARVAKMASRAAPEAK